MKLQCIALSFAVFGAALVTPVSEAHAEDVLIRLGTVAPRGTPWERQLKRTEKKFKEALGSVKMKSYFGGAKGDEKSIVRQVRDGRLEMAGVSMGALATAAPELRSPDHRGHSRQERICSLPARREWLAELW